MIKKIKYLWYDLVNGTKNLVKWFKVIWYDRDWDFYFLFNIMEKKFECMRDSGENYERIDLLIQLLRIIRDGYDGSMEYFDIEVTTKPIEGGELYEVHSTVTRDELDKYFDLHKAKVRKLKKKYPEYSNRRIASLLDMEIQKQATRVFYGTMEKYQYTWWS